MVIGDFIFFKWSTDGFNFFPPEILESHKVCLQNNRKESSNIFYPVNFMFVTSIFFLKVLFVTRVSYWHLCLSIVVGRLWETQSPVRCAKWDPTYSIMYAGSMCLQPRQLCYNIATNQSFAKWNRNKEKLHLFPVSSLFENFGKCLKASQNLQDQNDETWSVTFTG